MIYLVVVISYVVFVYAHGIYTQEDRSRLITYWKKIDAERGEKMSDAEYEQELSFFYHIPNIIVAFIQVVALQAKNHTFAYGVAFASLVLIGGLLLGLKNQQKQQGEQ